jgi:fibronectin-binding autotransporter adhesin
MRKRLKTLFLLSGTWLAVGSEVAIAQDTGAKASGSWESPSIWTGLAVPNSSNNVYIGSTSPTGAASTATVTLTANAAANNVYLGYGSGTSGTLNLGGNTLAITGSLFLGQGGTGVLNEGGGSFTATNAYVQGGNTLSFGASDVVSYVQLSGSGSGATTAATGNITSSIDVYSGSTLTAGANLNLSDHLNVQDGSTLNMQGHGITAANYVALGYNGSSAVTLQNLSTIATPTLYVGNGMAFNLTAADTVTNFYLDNKATSTLTNDVSYLQLTNGAAATTTATGGATSSIDVYSGSTLTAGANLNLSNHLNVQDGSTFNAQGHALTADTLLVGYNGTSTVSVTDLGQVTLNNLYVGNSTAGSNLTLHGGDVVNNLIDLQNGSVLTVQQTGGIGLTLNGTSSSSLTIDPSSMDLIFTLNSTSNWDFRWMDPTGGGNWISRLDSMIGSGMITISSPDGYSIVDQGGYTYIMGGISSVPEPSSLVMACLATAGLAAGLTWRRRRAVR